MTGSTAGGDRVERRRERSGPVRERIGRSAGARPAGLAVAAAALTLAVGCSAGPVDPPPDPATAAPARVRLVEAAQIPNVHIPGSLKPVAGTGTTFLVEGDGSDDPARYTLDNGRTWHEVPAGLAPRAEAGGFGSFIGYRGTFVGVRQEPEPDYSFSGFQRWDPVSGQISTLDYDLDPELPPDGDFDVSVFPIDYIGTLVVLNDSRIFDVTGTQALPVEPRLPDVPGG
ncbi:MAG: hypothetical protein AAGC63_16375, partial [Propionicimonas sp.]